MNTYTTVMDADRMLAWRLLGHTWEWIGEQMGTNRERARSDFAVLTGITDTASKGTALRLRLRDVWETSPVAAAVPVAVHVQDRLDREAKRTS